MFQETFFVFRAASVVSASPQNDIDEEDEKEKDDQTTEKQI